MVTTGFNREKLGARDFPVLTGSYARSLACIGQPSERDDPMPLAPRLPITITLLTAIVLTSVCFGRRRCPEGC